MQRYTHNHFTWIDLTRPSRDDAKALVNEFHINPYIADELLVQTPKPKIDTHEQYVFFVLHFPNVENATSEVDFIVGENFLITCRYGFVPAIDRFRKEFEMHCALEEHHEPPSAGSVFHAMILTLYQSLTDELDATHGRLKTIESNIFEENGHAMVRTLSELSRDLLDIEQTIEGHDIVLTELAHTTEHRFGMKLKRIKHAYHNIYRRVKNQREILAEVRTTNDSLLAAEQNQVGQVFTILAFSTLPATLIAGIFGMNVEFLFISGHQYGFWIVIALMAVVSGGTLLYFVYKRWL